MKRQCLNAAFGLLLSCVLIVTSSKAFATEITGVRLWQSPQNTRVVLDLDSPAEHKLFTLKSPHRVVIDMEGTSAEREFDLEGIEKTVISRVRFGRQKGGILRIVLDLKKQTLVKSFTLKKHGEKPDRLVLDLSAKASPQEKTVKKSMPDQLHSRRDIVIAIDAGHGGEDPGAIGPKRLREKDVVLSISKKLAALINKEPGYHAKLVRSGDYYVPLKKRRDTARALRSDLFISVHADAFKNPEARGASVFALSRHGATSETARFLARKENQADLIGGVGGVSLSDKDKVLAGVLVDLSMNATLSESLVVGEQVLKEMGKISRLHKNRVEQAGFAVLKSPDVPSILVETGFISNPKEAKKLATDSYRSYMANAIFKGVKRYFSDKPPPGTYLAWRQGPSEKHEYIIADGDTLSEIARKYRVDLKSLIEFNRLGNTGIRVGQRLLIPAS